MNEWNEWKVLFSKAQLLLWMRTVVIEFIKSNLPKHGSSDGRVGDSRSKRPGFNPCLDPMRCASNYESHW